MIRMFSAITLASLFCLAPLVLPAAAADQPAKPNVIVILADDLGYADVSAFGGNNIATPNIDRIAATGARLTQAYVTAPVCSPSRAAIMTGRYPQREGFEFNTGPAKRDWEQGLGLDLGETTLAAALKQVGYRTGLIGKWHLGGQEQFQPQNRGFDYFYGTLMGQTPYIDPKHPDAINGQPAESEETSGNVYKRNPLNSIYKAAPGVKPELVDNFQTFLTEDFGAQAVSFITDPKAKGTPYFLYLPFTAPHLPAQTTRKYWDRFADEKDDRRRMYKALIAGLDDAVGAVLDAVEKSGQADNTIIFFLSDNGCAAYVPGFCACQPLRGGKLSHYEGGVRVPFLVRWPGKIPAKTTFEGRSSSMDIFATVAAAAGVKPNANRPLDGVDLLPYLTGAKSGAPHERLMWRRAPMMSMVEGDWKLWWHQDKEFTLLFNLKNDPNESRNLAAQEPERVKAMQERYSKWNGELADPRWPTKGTTRYDVCGTSFELPI